MEAIQLSEDELQSPPSQNLGKKKASKNNPHKPSHVGLDFKRQRKLTSGVWAFFDFIDPNENNGVLYCKCKKCGQIYNAESKMGTGNLQRHIKNCKRSNFRDVGQLLLNTSFSNSLSNRSPDFCAEKFRELLAAAVVRHDLPFQFTEYEAIRKCFTYLHPDVKVVSRNTIKTDVLQMYKREKIKIKEALGSAPGRISLTSDCWSSITTDGYISLTAHFIDSNWCLQKVILNFCFLPPPHSGMALCNQVSSLLKDWGIQKKVFSITLDNASSNDVLADLLKSEIDVLCDGAYFHVRCCAHIMNLIVQDGLKDLDEAIIKVRESVKYCKGSQSRKQKFLSCVAHVELESFKGLRQDVPTRWNSTYMMLESVLYYKKAFIHLQKTDANYVHCPSSDEWGRIERIFKFLKVFYEVTLAFSGSKYPTANLYFSNVLKVRVLLLQEKDSQDKFMQKMASRMFLKFEKYWSEFSTIMAIAATLDPRYKFQIVEWGYEKVYGGAYEYELSLMKDKLFSLFYEYKAESPINEVGIESSQRSSTDYFDVTLDLLMQDFDNFSNKVTSQSVKSELDCYLEEQLMPRANNLNILDYWRTHEMRYPTLARMARDILAIPISTVASESAFSTGGRVIDPYRSSLKPSTVEACICLKDWIYGGATMEPQLEELCGAVMKLKVEDQVDSPENGSPEIDIEHLQFSPGTQDSAKFDSVI